MKPLKLTSTITLDKIPTVKLIRLFLGSNKPNERQLEFFANIFGDLSKAIFLGSIGLVFLPTKEPIRFSSAIIGLLAAAFCAIIGSRLLKEVGKK